jgi:hypothetical protein
MSRRGLAPFCLVLAVALVIWIVSGVGALDIAKFIGYEVAFVLLPGAALLWVLRGRREGALLTIALGWPLGQTLEILAFSATAAIGERWMFALYPIAIVALCALVIWRRPLRFPDAGENPTSNAQLWTAAGALSLGLIYLAIAFLPQVPLPSTTHTVSYYVDFPNYIGLIAEVKNHWPATAPGLVGFPMHYEWFVFDHMAAVSQVTGVGIPTIAFRLDFVPTILVLGCQLLAAGRFLGRSTWTGVIAIGVAFLLGPLDLTTDPSGASPFFDQFHFDLWANWTFPFGLMFLLALLYLVSEWLLAPSRRPADSIRALSLITLIMIGASGAKATILPVVITGTGLYVLADAAARRRISARAVLVVILGLLVFAATFVIVYAGGVPGTKIDPLVFIERTVPEVVASSIRSHALRDVARIVGFFIALAGILLPLTGMLYLLRRRHRPEIPRLLLCLCFLLAGIFIANVVHQVGDSELYFLDTGYLAGTLVAAAGLRLAWHDMERDVPISLRGAAVAFVAWIAVVAVVVLVTRPSIAHPAGLLLRYGVIAALAVMFVAAFVVRRGVRRAGSAGGIALGLIPALAVSVLAFPIQLAPTAKRVLTGEPITVTVPDPQTVRGLTPGLVIALNWLRNNTSVNTIIAVSNHWINPAETDGRYYYYSAFSERQVFVEPYNPLDYGLNYPPQTPAFAAYQYRTRLNDAVFDSANVAALQILTEQYGVRYLLIDRVHHNADPALLLLGRVVLSNTDATILAVGQSA